MIKSPITQKTNIKVERILAASTIVDLYMNSFSLDVSMYFKDIPELKLCKDTETGYQFFYPPVEGDSGFYEYFQNFDWYYMDSKWEFDVVSKFFSNSSKVLEIGCGQGSFIKKTRQSGFNITGLELNLNAVEELQKEGLNVTNEGIRSFSTKNREQYDFVVTFQVLEHIYDVNDFVSAAIDILKPGGKLIISVPNNESYIKYTFPMALNTPPHHVGLWTKKSLSGLGELFNLKREKVYYEPLQEYHFNDYYYTMKYKCISKIGKIAKLFFLPFRKNRYRRILKLFSRFIKGHSILVVYKKAT